MEKLLVLWGRKENEPSWMEDVITTAPANLTGRIKLHKALEWAKSNGYAGFRIMTDDGNTPPNFVACIRL
jgi:hypothetical protein